MHWIDWLVMTLPVITCGAIAIYTRRYVRSVADFMAGGREAGRFLICAARSEQGSGAAVFVASFQAFMVSESLHWMASACTCLGLPDRLLDVGSTRRIAAFAQFWTWRPQVW